MNPQPNRFDPTPTLKPNVDEILRTLRLLHVTGVVELRSFGTPEGIWSGYYDKSTLFVKDACDLASKETTPSVYHTLQDISQDLFNRRPNQMKGRIGTGETTSDADAVKYRWLPLDADPTRMGKVSSSDSEKALALGTIQKIREFLSDRGIESILADSGNGYHLLVRIDLPIEDKKLVEDLLHSFSTAFSTDAVHIDTAVSNPSRIWKLYGVPARKGENSPERPWRMSKLIDAPEGIQNRIVSREGLLSLLKDLQLLNPAAATQKKPVNASVNGEKIPNGRHDIELNRIAGKLRHDGMDEETIYNALVEICEKRFEGLGNDYLLMCRKHAANICKKPIGKDTTVLFNGAVAGAVKVEENTDRQEAIDRVRKELESRIGPYPKFPHFVMEGTSIYNGLVRPYCDVNSRQPEFLFMPAFTLLLNFIGTKVRVSFKDLIPSLYLIMIGKRGQLKKSSSVNDAIRYMKYAGVVDYASGVRNAEGRTLIWSAGSPEGLGMEAKRTVCSNMVLFYDELQGLVSKAGIENSTIIDALLKLYESGYFSNTIKSRKEVYTLEPGTYCASLISCVTDRKFKSLWSKMTGSDTGLTDRTFFLLQPEILKPPTPFVSVNTKDGALETRKLIDIAVGRGVYSILDQGPLAEKMLNEWKDSDRLESRAEKFALGFAVDLGREFVDEECVERGIALCEYERAVKRRLRPYEAENKDAALQLKIIDELSQNGGMMPLHNLERAAHFDRHGSYQWGNAVKGLEKDGRIDITGTGKKGSPKIVTLLRITATDGDE